ncbi:MAG: methane monooxygenase/ammonia monooxygenase subunit C [Methylococcus sp.]|nr:methane monooxygenase/ammonia monooxygenase subunit C [Methylococcus sp.]
MEELFVAPLHYGFVIFGWLALAVMGALTQTFYSFTHLFAKELCPDIH